MRRSKGSGRDRFLQRNTALREPKPRILVLCEGIETEPQYLRAFYKQERNRVVDVEIVGEGATPKTLVEKAVLRNKAAEKEARRRGEEYLKYRDVWCVFDVDQHPKVDDARQQARDNGIKLAISNPCFELWLLIHFCDHSSHIERHKVSARLREFIKDYVKHAPFELLRDGYDKAVRRAQQLDERHSKDGRDGSNPSTGVYRLTEQIREFGLNALFPLQKR